MGNTLTMFIWAIPLTLLNIYNGNKLRRREDGEDKHAHQYNPAFSNMYPPPPPKKFKPFWKRTSRVFSYKRDTRYGRTSLYPVDPFFKALNPDAMNKPCPRFNLETVFEESQHLLYPLNRPKTYRTPNPEATSKEPTEDNSHDQNDNNLSSDSEYESLTCDFEDCVNFDEFENNQATSCNIKEDDFNHFKNLLETKTEQAQTIDGFRIPHDASIEPDNMVKVLLKENAQKEHFKEYFDLITDNQLKT